MSSEKDSVKLSKQCLIAKLFYAPWTVSGLCITSASKTVMNIIIVENFTLLSFSSKNTSPAAAKNSTKPMNKMISVGQMLNK